MTKDLTAITTPYGLLDEETQRALREHGGPYEYFNSQGWWQVDPYPTWSHLTLTYRVKPQPPQPREWWLLSPDDGGIVLRSKSYYETPPAGAIHVREVIE